MIIWTIPGFLGHSSDWDFLPWNNVRTIESDSFAWSDLTDWGVQCNRFVQESSEKNANIMMGYSLGGRLALHALVENPSEWSAAVIISAHPGLSSLEERKRRWENDKNWAERFCEEDWESLMQSWNAQGVFCDDDFCFDRREEEYDREELSSVLLRGSLAKQEELFDKIAQLPLPILWITGEKDKRAQDMAKKVSFAHDLSAIVQVDGAGHRVPWSQPHLFISTVNNFLKTVI
jgi:2-succinyl-6-hydroxy-2,4-cyclohexadiene-1-carboxylate synthase